MPFFGARDGVPIFIASRISSGARPLDLGAWLRQQRDDSVRHRCGQGRHHGAPPASTRCSGRRASTTQVWPVEEDVALVAGGDDAGDQSAVVEFDGEKRSPSEFPAAASTVSPCTESAASDRGR